MNPLEIVFHPLASAETAFGTLMYRRTRGDFYQRVAEDVKEYTKIPLIGLLYKPEVRRYTKAAEIVRRGL